AHVPTRSRIAPARCLGRASRLSSSPGGSDLFPGLCDGEPQSRGSGRGAQYYRGHTGSRSLTTRLGFVLRVPCNILSGEGFCSSMFSIELVLASLSTNGFLITFVLRN